jgi:hypothetical protein
VKTLSLTSPLTKGPEVKAAQLTLNGGNAFKQDFLLGSVDGAFGEETGRACRRAKYWLGYPQKEQLPIYGDVLDGYLHGKKLPASYRTRRAARLRAAKQKPLRVKALEQAKRYIGKKENPPGSNRIDFASLWYKLIGPWCAMAVTRWYVDAGSKAFVKSARYAYVPYIVADAKAGRNGLALTKDPKPGDVVCYDWLADGVADHVGLFENWVAGAEGSEFLAVEGNTSLGNDSNGGEVMRRHRKRTQVQAFVRVGR